MLLKVFFLKIVVLECYWRWFYDDKGYVYCFLVGFLGNIDRFVCGKDNLKKIV